MASMAPISTITFFSIIDAFKNESYSDEEILELLDNMKTQVSLLNSFEKKTVVTSALSDTIDVDAYVRNFGIVAAQIAFLMRKQAKLTIVNVVRAIIAHIIADLKIPVLDEWTDDEDIIKHIAKYINIYTSKSLVKTVTDRYAKTYKTDKDNIYSLFNTETLYYFLISDDVNLQYSSFIKYYNRFKGSIDISNTFNYNSYGYFSQSRTNIYKAVYTYTKDDNLLLDKTLQKKYTLYKNKSGKVINLNNLLSLLNFDISACNCVASNNNFKQDIQNKRSTLIAKDLITEVDKEYMKWIFEVDVDNLNDVDVTEESILSVPEIQEIVTQMLAREQEQINLLDELAKSKQEYSMLLAELINNLGRTIIQTSKDIHLNDDAQAFDIYLRETKCDTCGDFEDCATYNNIADSFDVESMLSKQQKDKLLKEEEAALSKVSKDAAESIVDILVSHLQSENKNTEDINNILKIKKIIIE